MFKHFRQELHRITHSWLMLAIAAMLLVLNIVVNSSDIIGVFNFYYVDQPYYHLNTEEDFTHLIDDERKDRSFEEKRAEYGPKGCDAQNSAELYTYTAEAQYVRIMWFLGGLVLLCAVLPTALVALPLRSGVPQISAKLSGAPKRVAAAKIGIYFALVLIMSLVSALIQILLYAEDAVRMLGFGVWLRGLILRFLMDCMVMSVPLFLAFAVKSTVLSTLLNVCYGVLCYYLNVVAAGGETLLFVPFPPFLHGLRLLWKPETSFLWVLLAALVCLVYIALFSWSSVRLFVRRCKEGA